MLYMKLPKFLLSSSGNGELSQRAKSFLLAVLPALLLVAPIFGFKIEIAEGESLVNMLVRTIALIEGLIAVVWQIKGWSDRNFRKANKLGAFSE